MNEKKGGIPVPLQNFKSSMKQLMNEESNGSKILVMLPGKLKHKSQILDLEFCYKTSKKQTTVATFKPVDGDHYNLTFEFNDGDAELEFDHDCKWNEEGGNYHHLQHNHLSFDLLISFLLNIHQFLPYNFLYPTNTHIHTHITYYI